MNASSASPYYGNSMRQMTAKTVHERRVSNDNDVSTGHNDVSTFSPGKQTEPRRQSHSKDVQYIETQQEYIEQLAEQMEDQEQLKQENE